MKIQQLLPIGGKAALGVLLGACAPPEPESYPSPSGAYQLRVVVSEHPAEDDCLRLALRDSTGQPLPLKKISGLPA
jgi:hypothetical protein